MPGQVSDRWDEGCMVVLVGHRRLVYTCEWIHPQSSRVPSLGHGPGFAGGNARLHLTPARSGKAGGSSAINGMACQQRGYSMDYDACSSVWKQRLGFRFTSPILRACGTLDLSPLQHTVPFPQTTPAGFESLTFVQGFEGPGTSTLISIPSTLF